jgi:hypothetical protein
MGTIAYQLGMTSNPVCVSYDSYRWFDPLFRGCQEEPQCTSPLRLFLFVVTETVKYR